MDNILRIFDHENEEIRSQADKLFSVLTQLRYEGKARSDNNLKDVLGRIKVLDTLIKEHQGVQEKAVFPFLLKHVPRLEAVIRFLETEHEEIRENEAHFKRNILKLLRGKGVVKTGEVYDRGIYLVSLLKQHTGFEVRNIYRAIYDELREDEKSAVAVRIRKCLLRNRLRKQR